MADMAEKDHGTIPDVIAELGATLHPNHYIIFDLKETYVSSSQVMLIIILDLEFGCAEQGEASANGAESSVGLPSNLLTNSFPLF